MDVDPLEAILRRDWEADPDPHKLKFVFWLRQRTLLEPLSVVGRRARRYLDAPWRRRTISRRYHWKFWRPLSVDWPCGGQLRLGPYYVVRDAYGIELVFSHAQFLARRDAGRLYNYSWN